MIAMKFALGSRSMLMQAIYRHVNETHGLRPRRFELHPAVICDLRMALEHSEFIAWATDDPDKMVFHGVEIVADQQATRPKMITADNKVVYL